MTRREHRDVGMYLSARAEVLRTLLNASRRADREAEQISATTAASMSRQPRSLVLAACRSGALPAERRGGAWKIRRGHLTDWKAAGCQAEVKR